MTRSRVALVAVAFVGCVAARPATLRAAPDPLEVELRAQVREFLAAYARNDQATVLGWLDDGGLAVYGSDVSECVHSAAEVKQMMADDFALWKTARFGEPQRLSVVSDGEQASAFFDVGFSAGGGPEVVVRIAQVWRRVPGGWRLMQSSNVVPTTGSSAHELLERINR